MNIPLHVKIRRKIKSSLALLISKIVKKSIQDKKISKKEIKSIVIIRPNYRIGNIIFLTPLINELSSNLQDVKIDIIVGNKKAGEILEGIPSVSKVIDIPRKLLKNPMELYKLIKKSRSKRYDLAINISGGSLSAQIVTALVDAKYKASFLTDQNFFPLTHTVKEEGLYTHAGSKPLEILKIFDDIKLPQKDVELDIKLTKEEIIQAQADLQNITNSKKTVALFRGARFDKKIPDEWWIEFYKELKKLDKEVVVIDILSPDVPTKAYEEFLEYSNKDLRLLGAFFRSSSMYISADTGPLHLASASKAHSVALLNKTSPKIYGLLGKEDVTLDINSLTPKDVAAICYEKVLKDAN